MESLIAGHMQHSLVVLIAHFIFHCYYRTMKDVYAAISFLVDKKYFCSLCVVVLHYIKVI